MINPTATHEVDTLTPAAFLKTISGHTVETVYLGNGVHEAEVTNLTLNEAEEWPATLHSPRLL